MDVAVPADPCVNSKEIEKRDKCLDFARELKKTKENERSDDTNCKWSTWNNPNGLMKGLEDVEIRRRAETTQTRALLRSPGILRRVLETGGDKVLLKFQWKTIS